MARGAPDDGNVLSPATFNRVDDMAELAARLGGAYVFHRGGNVIYQNIFNDGFNRLSSYTAILGGTLVVVNGPTLSGGLALKFGFIAVAGSGGNIKVSIPQMVQGKVGLTAGIRLSLWEGYVEIKVICRRRDRLRLFGVRIYPQTDTMKYQNAAAAWVQLTDDLGLTLGTAPYRLLKLIVDPDTGYYDRLVFGDAEYDMITLQGVDIAPAAPFLFEFGITVWGDGGAVNNTWLDHIVGTRNEP